MHVRVYGEIEGLKVEKRISLLFSLLVLLSLAACSGKEEGGVVDSFWADKPVIAEKRVVDGDTVIVCDVGKIMSKVDLPFEVIATDYRMVPLENTVEAFLGLSNTPTVVTENYLGFYCFTYMPFKLFKRTGEFVCDAGGIGQGPGEYFSLVDAQVDEANQRIYLLPLLLNKIFVYDFQGNYLSDIPLAYNSTKGRFRINPEREEIVFATSVYEGRPPSFVWTQDFQGNVLKEIRVEDFPPCQTLSSNTVINNYHQGVFDLFLFSLLESPTAYLYHYDKAANRLVPQFRVENYDKSIFIYELPSCYIVESTHNTGPEPQLDLEGEKIIVDKKTLRGCYITGVRMPFGVVFGQYNLFAQMKDGHFAVNVFSGNILELMDLQNMNDLSIAERAELEKVMKVIDSEEDEISLIFTGKLRD